MYFEFFLSNDIGRRSCLWQCISMHRSPNYNWNDVLAYSYITFLVRLDGRNISATES